MEDGERIPIQLEQPAEAVGETVLEDGTVVIDIHAPPCPAGGDSEPDETIVVCAQSERMAELAAEDAAGDQPRAVKLQISENADATLIGSTEAGPMGGNGQEASVRLRVGF